MRSAYEGFFLQFFFIFFTFLFANFTEPSVLGNFGEGRAVWYIKYDITKEYAISYFYDLSLGQIRIWGNCPDTRLLMTYLLPVPSTSRR